MPLQKVYCNVNNRERGTRKYWYTHVFMCVCERVCVCEDRVWDRKNCDILAEEMVN